MLAIHSSIDLSITRDNQLLSVFEGSYERDALGEFVLTEHGDRVLRRQRQPRIACGVRQGDREILIWCCGFKERFLF